MFEPSAGLFCALTKAVKLGFPSIFDGEGKAETMFTAKANGGPERSNPIDEV
jgi:hypothetical protein